MSVTVRDASGDLVANGTLVLLVASFGTLAPSTATTSGGVVTVSFTAPSNQGGTVAITAHAGGASGSTTIQVNCSLVVPTSVPPVPPIIQPPSTGDAGLLQQGSTSLLARAGGLMAGIVFLGGSLVLRRRLA